MNLLYYYLILNTDRHSASHNQCAPSLRLGCKTSIESIKLNFFSPMRLFLINPHCSCPVALEMLIKPSGICSSTLLETEALHHFLTFFLILFLQFDPFTFSIHFNVCRITTRSLCVFCCFPLENQKSSKPFQSMYQLQSYDLLTFLIKF